MEKGIVASDVGIIAGFFYFSYKPRVSHGAIAVQPLQGWQNKTPTGFNRNSPALQRGDCRVFYSFFKVGKTKPQQV